ncbi:hypothetical protein OROGR_028282 [Orobanche gracilis]
MEHHWSSIEFLREEEKKGTYIHPPSASPKSTLSIEWDEEPTREETIAYDDEYGTPIMSPNALYEYNHYGK